MTPKLHVFSTWMTKACHVSLSTEGPGILLTELHWHRLLGLHLTQSKQHRRPSECSQCAGGRGISYASDPLYASTCTTSHPVLVASYLMQPIQQKGQELLRVVLCEPHELVGLVGHQLLQQVIQHNVHTSLYTVCA